MLMKYEVSWKPVDEKDTSVAAYGTMMREINIGRKLTFKDVSEVHRRDGHYIQLLEDSEDKIRFVDASLSKIITYKLVEE
jgi:hypothetical protein